MNGLRDCDPEGEIGADNYVVIVGTIAVVVAVVVGSWFLGWT